ncbi:MAG: hypothetical protein ABIH90_00080 [Candidatus Aenigmatarchaeota archaeon]
MNSKKGQFFLLGAVLLITAFFIGSAVVREVFITIPNNDLAYISANLVDEYPKALNLGHNSSGGTDALINFSTLVNSTLSERYIDFKGVWATTENTSTDLNVTVGNWMHSAEAVVLSIGASSQSLDVAAGGTNYTNFTGPGNNFTLHVNFSESNGTLYTWRDKVSLYLYMNMSRGDNSVIREESY